MNRSSSALVVLCLAFAALHACSSSRQTREMCLDLSMLRSPDDGMQGELEWTGRVEICDKLTELARIDVTSKGNGFLRMCGQEFRVYDDHDDGAVFDPPFVRVMFLDLDNDGYRDLLLCGMVRTTDCSKGSCGTRFLRAYRYDANVRQFAPW